MKREGMSVQTKERRNLEKTLKLVKVSRTAWERATTRFAMGQPCAKSHLLWPGFRLNVSY